MNENAKRKALETKAANREKWDNQTIVIDETWSIVRVDELNWQIRHKDRKEPYESLVFWDSPWRVSGIAR